MSIRNNDELTAPSWLTKEYLQNILREDEKQNDLEIINLTLTPATVKGGHFASWMFRAKIEYRIQKCDSSFSTRSLIVKTLPEVNSDKGQLLHQLSLFETEISMYSETIPQIEKILEENGDKVRLAPKLIYSSLEPRKVLILEDLCTQGYEALRNRSINKDELKAVLSKLAKFHAVTYMLGKSDRAELVTKYQEGPFSNPAVKDMDFIAGGIKRFMHLLDSIEELRVYLPYFRVLEGDIYERVKDLYSAYKLQSPEEILVLIHGDFHIKNLMFKFDEGNNCEDILMVDFQASVFAPSNIDLIYATFMLFDPETRREKRSEVMRHYFDSFISTLKKIDFEGKLPSYSDFQMSSIRHGYFSMFLLSTFLPLKFVGKNLSEEEQLEDVDTSKFLLGTDSMMPIYFNPAFIREVKKLLPILLNEGFLD